MFLWMYINCNLGLHCCPILFVCMTSDFINIKKNFKKLYMFYFETFWITLTPSSVKKIFLIHLFFDWRMKMDWK